MKIQFEEGDFLNIFDKELMVQIVEEDKLICSCGNEYPIELTNLDKSGRFFISPRWYIKFAKIKAGSKIKSKAHGEIIFDGVYNGFIHCHISENDDTRVVFNKDGRLCWWNKENGTWCYDDESEIMLDIWVAPNYKLIYN